ncbi:hypothetical protein [Phascolarctobacterium faecium]|jgi:hypothetical protein|uniref:hypothetical protein n=1 Tax=Phascolarctobacterium faecium TaxID=33025 RepID=UPI0020540500|nr:hypothetical protein [uncultured Phascolarctobacterium sp.]DAR52247.1 MAG TPA: hypothetical protein [Caudoviricetes sp.]
MTLTTDEAIQVLEAIRNCLDPRRVRYGADWRKDKALCMAIEKLKEDDQNG